MKFAYADPPYLGCALRLYGDATYDDARAHRSLIQQLIAQYPDGWALSLSSSSLKVLLPMCPEDCRVAAWVKPFVSFKPGVHPAYCWEPLIFRGGRTQRSRSIDTVRDYHSEVVTIRRGTPTGLPRVDRGPFRRRCTSRRHDR